jgi:DNA polymerase IV
MPRPIDNRGELETVTIDLLKLVFPMEKAVRLLGLSVSGYAGDEDLGHPKQIALELYIVAAPSKPEERRPDVE